MRGVRENSDIEAGIAYNSEIGASKKFVPLIGMKYTNSVRYFDDTIFGIQNQSFLREVCQVDFLKVQTDLHFRI